MQRPAVPGFAWTSDSDEAIGETLSFGLVNLYTLTEAQFQFPVGDTYQFDLEIFSSLDGTGEPYVTIPVSIGAWCSTSVGRKRIIIGPLVTWLFGCFPPLCCGVNEILSNLCTVACSPRGSCPAEAARLVMRASLTSDPRAACIAGNMGSFGFSPPP